jgi:hypothetical protein
MGLGSPGDCPVPDQEVGFSEQICNGGGPLRSHNVTTEICPQTPDGSIAAKQPRRRDVEKVKATQLTSKIVQFGSTF